ncbi:hypothetical protein ACLQ2Q_20715 [Microbacterium sp. DT81.1]|uniref:hypothetical protein n=1 Tax=Microbacterium sp. DT81.1 TaxID=3393413 RepID=UPI003CF7CAC9
MWPDGRAFLPTVEIIQLIREVFPDRWGEDALRRPLSPQLFAAILRPLPRGAESARFDDRMGRWRSALDALLQDMTPEAPRRAHGAPEPAALQGVLLGSTLIVQLPEQAAHAIAARGCAWILRDPPPAPRDPARFVPDPPTLRADPPPMRVQLVTPPGAPGRLIA